MKNNEIDCLFHFEMEYSTPVDIPDLDYVLIILGLTVLCIENISIPSKK